MIRDGKIARARYSTGSLAPTARLLALAHYCVSHVLKVFLQITDLVVFDYAHQVSN